MLGLEGGRCAIDDLDQCPASQALPRLALDPAHSDLAVVGFGVNTGYEIESLPQPRAEGASSVSWDFFAADGDLRSQPEEDVALRLERDFGVDLVRGRRWPAPRLEL